MGEDYERMIRARDSMQTPIKYGEGVKKTTQILFNNALNDRAFGGKLLEKLNIERQDVSSMEILNLRLKGVDKNCYKLIIQDKKNAQYEIALRTIGIDQEPFQLYELPIVESIVADNEQILESPAGKEHVPLHYAHIYYSIEEIPGIATPDWYRYNPVHEHETYTSADVGYWVLADEWIEGPTLEELQGRLTSEGFISIIQQVIIALCNGLNESLLWAAVDPHLDNITVSEKHGGRVMFLDVGYSRESGLVYGKEAEIHETLLSLYKTYVYNSKYCNSKQFFEAVEASTLSVRMPEVLSLMRRDNRLLENSMVFAGVAIDFREKLEEVVSRLVSGSIIVDKNQLATQRSI